MTRIALRNVCARCHLQIQQTRITAAYAAHDFPIELTRVYTRTERYTDTDTDTDL